MLRLILAIAIALPGSTLAALAQALNPCQRAIAVFETESSYDITICEQADGELMGQRARADRDRVLEIETVQPFDEDSYELERGDTTYIVTPYSLEIWQNNRLIDSDRVIHYRSNTNPDGS